jgi:hypothetical protein
VSCASLTRSHDNSLRRGRAATQDLSKLDLGKMMDSPSKPAAGGVVTSTSNAPLEPVVMMARDESGGMRSARNVAAAAKMFHDSDDDEADERKKPATDTADDDKPRKQASTSGKGKTSAAEFKALMLKEEDGLGECVRARVDVTSVCVVNRILTQA